MPNQHIETEKPLNFSNCKVTINMKQYSNFKKWVFLHVLQHNFKYHKVFFLLVFSFLNIHNSQDHRGRERLLIQLFSITSTWFLNTSTLTGWLLKTAYLCTQLAARLEQETFPLNSSWKQLWALNILLSCYLFYRPKAS